MAEIPFTKMHGLGNDFVVLDARNGALGDRVVGAPAARAIADRRTGIGCDQLIILEAPDDGPSAGNPTGDAEAFMRIRNADGGEVEACGNATRCIGALLMGETGRDRAVIRTAADLLTATRTPDQAARGLVTVDMGVPRFEWDRIPLSVETDTLHLDLARGPLSDPAAASMGNPHATFFVEDAVAAPIAVLGPELEVDSIFPERANIGVAQIIGLDRMRLRVWERGAGLTPACGTGACAAVVNAHRRGLSGRRMIVIVDGGTLEIDWRDDNRVYMTGPAVTSFTGLLPEDVADGIFAAGTAAA